MSRRADCAFEPRSAMRALAERLSKTWSRGVVGGVSGMSEKQSWWSGGNDWNGSEKEVSWELSFA